MTYPTYPIYDLNDRNAATPVNIKELEEEDEAELLSTAANNSTLTVGTEEITTPRRIRNIRVAASVLAFLLFGGLIGWAVSTYVDTTENERASFTRN